MVGIYSITNKINGKRYIGKSENIEARTSTLSRNKRLDSAIKHYGEENFIVEIIEECDKELLNEREIYWIAYYHTYINDPQCQGYNMTKGGDGVDSDSASRYNKEYWEKEGVRESRSGEHHHMYGKHHTEESRKLQSISAHNRPPISEKTREKYRRRMKENNPMFSAEVRLKLSESRKGMIFSEEHRRNIGLSAKGRTPWNKGKELGPHTKEHNYKISESLKGTVFTEERCNNIKKAKQGKVSIYLGKDTKYIDDSELEQYLSLGWSKGIASRVYHLKCHKCGEEFEASHNTYKFCENCR